MAFVSSLSVSSNQGLLSALYSFVVTTLSWTPVASGVSGVAEGFVARSSGTSGDRLIIVKFGGSVANQSGISVFACTAFNSATSTATNPTTDKNLSLSGTASITVYFEGDKDHIFVGTAVSSANGVQSWIYAGLTQEFSPTLSQFPTHVIVTNSLDIETTTGRLVEGPPGTYNSTIYVGSFDFTNVLNRCDPDLITSNILMFPVVVAHASVDRLYGTLRNCYGVGGAISHAIVITAPNGSGTDYVVFQSRAASQKTGIAVRAS
ncbi:MAG TPA: hypothetical protein VNP04_13655 [Alphaproteobacteria bacterium]|nr:hypothetical protein [Alphaproteobacteria bacterium]